MVFISSIVGGERKEKGDIKVNLLVKTERSILHTTHGG